MLNRPWNESMATPVCAMSARADCRTRCRRAADLFLALPPSASALSSEEAGGPVMSCRKVPAVRYTAHNTCALVQYEAGDNPRRLGKSVEDLNEDERLMSI
jgi:hypothetical protein